MNGKVQPEFIDERGIIKMSIPEKPKSPK